MAFQVRSQRTWGETDEVSWLFRDSGKICPLGDLLTGGRFPFYYRALIFLILPILQMKELLERAMECIGLHHIS